jgi:quercetin dioxygenase-like cupin family protein
MLEFRSMKPLRLFLAVLFCAVMATAQAAAPIIEITAEPSHHLLFENPYARAVKIDLAPHAAMVVHHHRYDYIFVVLAASKIENDIVGKAPFLRAFQEGETVFVPGPFAHTAKNLTDYPFQVVAVELLQGDKLQPSRKWDEERGLHILNGGTQDVLFVKDHVRATDLELNPGGVLPKHHHDGPHVLVAITDLHLRSDIEGKAPASVELKAGDAAWVKAGDTHTLTNIGTKNARLITLEF